MKKPSFIKLTLLVLIALFSSNGLTISSVHAREYIDIVEFAGLPKVDQRRLVKTSQLLMANYEEVNMRKYRRRQKYTTLQTLLDLMIDSAHAQGYQSYPEIGANGSPRLCIYAGWITYIKPNTKCPHPLAVDESSVSYTKIDTDKHKEVIRKNKATYKKLQKENKMSEVCGELGEGTSAMLCNPKLFGTKKSVGGKPGAPFCSVGNTNPFNSSYGCIKAVDKYAKDEAAKGTKSSEDIKNDIYDVIITEGLKGDQSEVDSLSNMLRLNYDICMCKGEGRYIDDTYAKTMYKERTCYAWLLQTREIISHLDSKSCQKFDKMTYQKSKSSSNANVYSMFDWANKASENINKAILEASNESNGYFDESTMVDKQAWRDRDDYDSSQCPIHEEETIYANPSESKDVAGHILIKAGIDQIALKGGEQPHTGWSYTPIFDAVKCPEPSESVENDKDTKGNELNHFKRLSCEYTVNVRLEGFDDPVSVKIAALNEKVVGECAFVDPVEDTREFKIKETQDKDNTSELTGQLTLIVTPKIVTGETPPSYDGATITWTGAEKDGSDDKKATYSKKEATDISVIVKIGNNTEYSCSYPAPEIVKKKEDKPSTNSYTITLKQEDDGDKKVNIIATVKKGKEVITNLAQEDLKIDWTKVIKGKVIEKDKKTDDGTETGSTTEDDTSKDIALNSLEIKQNVPKKTTEQIVTASLKKDGKEISAPKETIAALKGKKDEEEEEKTVKMPNNSPSRKSSQQGLFIKRNKGKFLGNR